MIVELASTLEKVTLEQLRTLRAVAETESFSGAARSLGKVQSAVSQAMDRLERELGLRLFDRSARSVRLTQAGRSVATAAMRVAREAESLAELANSLAVGVETKLAIVVDSIVPVPALVSFAREFEQTNPRVALSLYTETLSAVTHLVRTKQAAFGIAGPAADATGLERARVGEVRLVPVCATSHPLARVRGRIGPSLLRGHVQVVLSERAGQAGVGTGDQGVLSARTWRVVDLSTKLSLLRGGLGWGNMPEHLVRDDLARGELTVLRVSGWGPDEHRLTLSLVRREGALDGPVTRAARLRLSRLCREAL